MSPGRHWREGYTYWQLTANPPSARADCQQHRVQWLHEGGSCAGGGLAVAAAESGAADGRPGRGARRAAGGGAGAGRLGRRTRARGAAEDAAGRGRAVGARCACAGQDLGDAGHAASAAGRGDGGVSGAAGGGADMGKALLAAGVRGGPRRRPPRSTTGCCAGRPVGQGGSGAYGACGPGCPARCPGRCPGRCLAGCREPPPERPGPRGRRLRVVPVVRVVRAGQGDCQTLVQDSGA